jgi:hypothetical protein
MAIHFILTDPKAEAPAPALQIQTIRKPRELLVSPSCLAELANISQQRWTPMSSVSNPIHHGIYLDTDTGCPTLKHIAELVEIAGFVLETCVAREMLAL